MEHQLWVLLFLLGQKEHWEQRECLEQRGCLVCLEQRGCLGCLVQMGCLVCLVQKDCLAG